MKIETLSTFPEMFDSVMGSSMMKRAQEASLLEFIAYDLRDWTFDKHRTTDDYPYGGGEGLVMMCDPIYRAVEDILDIEDGSLPYKHQTKARIIIADPKGKPFNDAYANELAEEDRLLFICGHYEGIDERVFEMADDVINLGDYVLTSGELASMVIIDAVARKIPGVLGAETGAISESFAQGLSGLLEYPQYTRPSDYRGMKVPEILLSGHHAKIEEWRHRESLKETYESRPDIIGKLIENALIEKSDIEFIKSLE